MDEIKVDLFHEQRENMLGKSAKETLEMFRLASADDVMRQSFE